MIRLRLPRRWVWLFVLYGLYWHFDQWCRGWLPFYAFHAQYRSRCPVCDRDIHEDDLCEWLEGEVVHKECHDEEVG